MKPSRPKDKLHKLADVMHELAKLERQNAELLAEHGFHTIARNCERIADKAEKTMLAIWEGEYDR